MSFFSNLSTLFGPGQKTGKPSHAAKHASQDASQKPTVAAGAAPRIIPVEPLATKSGQPQAGKHGLAIQTAPTAQTQTVQPTSGQVIAPAKLKISDVQIDQTTLVREAQAKAREIVVEAKTEALAIRAKAEEDAKTFRRSLEEQQHNLAQKLDRIDIRLEQLDAKEATLAKRDAQLAQEEQKIVADQKAIKKKLEQISGLTSEEAKAELFDTLGHELNRDLSQFIRQKQEEAKAEAEDKAREILIDSMLHGATDYVAEYTVSVVQLPNEEAKGKIIGKQGRNINAFERETGVDVDLDMSPTEVRLSCFDPVRREVARIALERLIKDGRIQPSRIEEVVAKVRSEVDKLVFEAGKRLCHELGVYNLPVELMAMLGKFKYRFSYGQNLIAHTMEETKIGIKLASELGADVNIVRLGCLLHDIGKVSEEEEGSHVELGIKIAKRFNLPQSVIDCIAQHHEDEPFTGPEQMLVYIADAISGARPGARYENYEEYVSRLNQLETIATSHKEVKAAFAIQAGREIRVLLEPEATKDDDVMILSRQIRDEIKAKVTYPGTVTVTVIRETRGKEVAS